MLRYKIKETLLLRGQASPIQWLITNCGFGKDKAANIINNRQKAINIDDISMICSRLVCWPNDLYYWENSESHPLPPGHPCLLLEVPAKINDWNALISKLKPEQLKEIRRIADEMIDKQDKPSI